MSKLVALPSKLIVNKLKHGERILGSIIIKNDDATSRGIRPRWAQVYSVGDDITDVNVGEWVLVKHGRWTRGFKFGDAESTSDLDDLHVIDYPDAVLLVSEDEPVDDGFVDI